jgi:hypothetical protein
MTAAPTSPGRAGTRIRLDRTTLAIAAGLVALTVLSVILRTRAIGAGFWMDEGLSVGIASHDLLDIPNTLRQDGSPPLYYMLLHVWMDAFGSTEARTHVLSLLFATASIPAGLWVGWSLFGRRAGVILMALCGLNAFLTVYAQETRMYALVAFLSILLTGAFIQAFVYRRSRWAPAFGVLLALLLYSHNWGLFVSVAAAVALIPCLPPSGPGRRTFLRDAAIGFGIAAVLYAPWIPSLLFQAAHTGAPWTQPPRFGFPIQISRGVFGGSGVIGALLIATVLGARSAWANRRSPEFRALAVLIILPVVTLALAWGLSQLTPAWNIRYFGVLVGPLLILAAYGTSRAGAIGIAAVVFACLLSLRPQTYNITNKSNARDIGAIVRPALRPGDLVITGQPEQLPAMNYYLPGDYQWATTFGSAADPRVTDWRDGLERLRGATVEKDLDPLIARLPVGAHVLFVRPVTFGTSNWAPEWTLYVRRRSAQWGGSLAADRRLKLTLSAPTFYRHASFVGLSAQMYTKVRPG